MEELKIPEDLKFWHNSLLDDKETHFNAPVAAVKGLIERIASLSEEVERLKRDDLINAVIEEPASRDAERR